MHVGGVVGRVLGPIELQVAGERVSIAGPKQRAVLAALALEANRVVSLATLVDAVWGDPAPDRAEHTLQQHVSALRKVVGASALSTQSPGYVLLLDGLDVHDFSFAATEGFDALAAERWDDAVAAFDTALGHWRGPALADARDTRRLDAAAVALEEKRLMVIEARLEARLQQGQARQVVAELEQLVNEHPLRERLRSLLMLALYRSGRQADALAAYQDARRVLTDELGLEPSAELRDLEQAVLMQSPALDNSPADRAADMYATFRAGTDDAGQLRLPDGQTVLLISGSALIGRDPSALVRLVDSRVSRRHAEIEVGGGHFVLRDLGSTNGTTVNGEQVTERLLHDHDRVGIGGVELQFLTSGANTAAPGRMLTTVLFTDIVDSTKRAATLGDGRWRELLEQHHRVVRDELERFQGEEIGTTGDGFLARFDGPARAVQCALAICRAVADLGIEVRTGLHSGEVERIGDNIGGITVHIGARVSALAGPSEVLVSRTVVDLVGGSGIEFEDRGDHELKGVPGTWKLFAVTP